MKCKPILDLLVWANFFVWEGGGDMIVSCQGTIWFRGFKEDFWADSVKFVNCWSGGHWTGFTIASNWKNGDCFCTQENVKKLLQRGEVIGEGTSYTFWRASEKRMVEGAFEVGCVLTVLWGRFEDEARSMSTFSDAYISAISSQITSTKSSTVIFRLFCRTVAVPPRAGESWEVPLGELESICISTDMSNRGK